MSELIKEYLMKQAAGEPFIKRLGNIRHSPAFRKILTAGTAGGLTSLAIMPIDTISDTQKQWRNTRGEPELNRISHSFLGTAKELARPKVRENTKGGVRPFYAGAAGKLMKTIPSNALMFALEQQLHGKVFK